MDRNVSEEVENYEEQTSLSARRAWIEILFCVGFSSVAKASLSARRAWIEMLWQFWPGLSGPSLSARRAWIEIFVPFDVIRPAIGRSPQGERG